MRIVNALTILLLVSLLAGCQTSHSTGYGKPRKDSLSSTGYYIPIHLEDALIEVDRIMGEKGRAEVLNATDMIQYHLGLGLWIRNNWGLWHDSRLAKYFEQLGIHHADDMSGIILDSYWRKMHGRPIDLSGQVRDYQDYWKAQETNKGN